MQKMIIWIVCFCLLTSCQEGEKHIFRIKGNEGPIRSIPLPQGEEWKNNGLRLLNLTNGETYPVQRHNDQVFFIDSSPDEERAYKLTMVETEPDKKPDKVRGGQIMLGTEDQPIARYHIDLQCPADSLPEYYCRNGFIHPLYSPQGKVLTDGFPVGHTHQHGIFFAWVNTHFRGDFVDFWNQQKETGTVKHQEVVETYSGPVFEGFKTKLQQVSLKHGPVIDETWEVKAYNLQDYFILDLISTHKNIKTDTLFIHKYHYGGLGIRGNAAWNSEDPSFNDTYEVLTSEGKTTAEANHTRPKWTAAFGEVDGAYAGLAVIDHPGNFRHPQPVRVHPVMPYFCQAPMVLDSIPMAPGQVYESKYRIVAFDGKPDEKRLDQLAGAFR